MTDCNPLLDLSSLPRFQDIEVKHIGPALEAVLKNNRRRIAELTSTKQAPTWAGFVAVLEQLDDTLDRVWAPVSHLNSVMDNDELREVYDACLAELSRYYTELGQNVDLFNGFKQLRSSEEYNELGVAQKRVIDNALRDFRLSGVALEPAKKARFKEISEKLSQLGNQFNKNLLDATDAWSLTVTDQAQLGGLPQSALDMASEAAKQAGEAGWRFTLKAPSFLPFMTYLDNRALRREMYEAYVTRASELGQDGDKHDNSQIILDILRLRREKAALLEFENYAAYSLESKMASNADEVESFLSDLAGRSHPAARKELESLNAFAHEHFGVEALEAWDLAYYSEKQKQQLFEFSEEELRPWFPLSTVLNGMFQVVNRLFGITVRPSSATQLWHQDVRAYEILDETGGLRGRFFVDLYARDRKRGGAWMAECVCRRLTDSGVQTPTAFLTCNFSPPVGDKPSLLTHDEVLTLFHEFGHGLHHMLTQVDFAAVSGINGVEWDAVELPSQFLENWCWEEEALSLISGHYETGEALPKEMLAKLKAGRNFQAAMQMVRQLEFSLFDLRLHNRFDPDGEISVQQLLDSVREEVAVVIPPAFNRFQNSFGHIFGGGYAAGYYSYKWAEVLSSDAFSKFEENGIFDPATGQAFLINILEKGGSSDAMALFVAFRGRKPTVDALLRHSGLDS